MTVGAKCGITSLALKKITELHWGTKLNVDDKIIQNYIESLGCKIDSDCYKGDDDICDNPTIVFLCKLKVDAISNIIDENTITFYIKDEDLTAGVPPYTYHWSFEQDDFDISGAVDVDQAVLTVKVGKDINLLVSSISVLVTDSQNCKAIKNCYLTPGGIMKCADDFVPCSNSSGLRVVSKTTYCVKPLGLTVTKKL